MMKYSAWLIQYPAWMIHTLPHLMGGNGAGVDIVVPFGTGYDIVGAASLNVHVETTDPDGMYAENFSYRGFHWSFGCFRL
jgi:hypothetical protein